jgi:RNA polymerase sigma-70 factor, ECF subfamily
MADERLIREFLNHRGLFMGYLMAVTRDPEAAEEVFQQVAVAILERKQNSAAIPEFLPWAKEVVRRQALYYLRETRRETKHVRPVAPELLEGLSRAFLEDAGGSERFAQERKLLGGCLDKLPARQRELIALRYDERRSFQEIAEAVRSTATAVQRSVSRIRVLLHDCVHRSRELPQQG